jgi:uroporphyrinogen decarboxylase
MTNDLQLTPDGLQSWFMRMLNDPRVVHEFLEKACEAALCKIKLVNQAVGKYSDILMIAHDFGDRRGIQVGPDLWREIYKPHYKRLFSGWKNITRMKIGMHSCGSIVDILEDLIDSGLDIINPIQISARGMDPAILTRKFGNRAILYGGSYDSVLNTVDLPAEVVYERVRTNIKTLATNGRYIFSGVHNLQWDIPDSHLIAILQAYCDCKANV